MSSDESSDDYGRPRRGAAKKGRKGRRNEFGASTSSAGPAKVKLKVKTGGDAITGKKGVKGGYTITNVSGKDANVPPQWQGFGDRELDSDTEEPLVFEEAFILRMPVPTNEDQVKELERFSDMVKKREPMDEKDVWFKFMDSRRAVFNLGQTMYNAKLVDLPCLIESQKTLDGKHVFKTADISQVRLSFFENAVFPATNTPLCLRRCCSSNTR
jgi:transcription initiation factor TFIID subunit 7